MPPLKSILKKGGVAPPMKAMKVQPRAAGKNIIKASTKVPSPEMKIDYDKLARAMANAGVKPAGVKPPKAPSKGPPTHVDWNFVSCQVRENLSHVERHVKCQGHKGQVAHL